MQQLVSVPLISLTDDQERVLEDLFSNINLVDGMKVHVTLEARKSRVLLEMNHPNDEFAPVLGHVYGTTAENLLHDLNVYKIPYVSSRKRQSLVAFAHVLSLNAPNIGFVLKECYICYEYTDLELPCFHNVCPKCAYRVMKCPACRAPI